MEKNPSLFDCHLATHSKSSCCGSRESVRKYSFCFVLETSQYPSGLGLEEIALLVCLNCKYPSSCKTIFRPYLPQVNEIKNLVINPRSVFKMFCFSILFVVPSNLLCRCFLSRTTSHFGSCTCSFSAGRHTAFRTCLLFDHRLHQELQFLYLHDRWSLH